MKEITRLEESTEDLADNQKEKIKKRPEIEEQLEKLQRDKKVKFKTSKTKIKIYHCCILHFICIYLFHVCSRN